MIVFAFESLCSISFDDLCITTVFSTVLWLITVDILIFLANNDIIKQLEIAFFVGEKFFYWRSSVEYG